jgi:Uma2 family endonuclease
MAATLTTREIADRVVLRGVSWELYEKILREIGDQPLYLTYDEGDLEIMSPSRVHERWKTLIGRLLELLTLERDVPVESLGSTTFKRADLAKGLEPDECYYIQNEAAVRGRDDVDLDRDPPPDLVVEVDISRHGVDREGIYAALGVPELWKFDGSRLEAWVLGPDRAYRRQDHSRALPELAMQDLQRFLDMRRDHDETTVMRAFRDWLRASPAQNPPSDKR